MDNREKLGLALFISFFLFLYFPPNFSLIYSWLIPTHHTSLLSHVNYQPERVGTHHVLPQRNMWSHPWHRQTEESAIRPTSHAWAHRCPWFANIAVLTGERGYAIPSSREPANFALLSSQPWMAVASSGMFTNSRSLDDMADLNCCTTPEPHWPFLSYTFSHLIRCFHPRLDVFRLRASCLWFVLYSVAIWCGENQKSVVACIFCLQTS